VLAASSNPSQSFELKVLEIRERINRMRETYNKYDEIQLEIDVISNDEKEIAEYRKRFEAEYFHCIDSSS